MLINIESPGIKPGENLTEMLRNRFNHLGRMYNRITHCDVVLRKEKSDNKKNFIIEAKMEVPRKMLFAIEKEETFEIALDKVAEDLEHQLRNYKEELEDAR